MSSTLREKDNFQQPVGNSAELSSGHVEELTWRYYLTPRFVGSYFALILTACNLYVSYNIPVSLLPVINADIGPDSNINLVPLLHTLLKGVGLLVVGRLTDIFGRRCFLIGGQILCGVGSIPCALSGNVNSLLAGTVVLALGGSVQPLYPLYCQVIVPNRFRALSQATITLCILPFFGFGPVLGRLLVQNTALGWRATYWINAAFCFASAILYCLCYFPPDYNQINPGKTRRQQLAELDYIGLALYVGGAVVLLLGFVWSTDVTLGGWPSARVISLVVVGGVALIAFGFWEAYGNAKTRIVPLHLFKVKGYLAIIAVGCVSQMCFFSFNLFLPQIAQNLFNVSNIEIGLISTTTNAGIAIGEIIAGFVWKRVKHNRLQIMLACTLLVLFAGLMALTNQYQLGVTVAIAVLAGVSIGWTQLSTLVTCGLIVPVNDIGIGQGFFGSCRNILGTIATSIFVSINGNRLPQEMEDRIPPAVIGAGLPPTSVPTLLEAAKTGKATALKAVPGINSTIIEAFSTAQKDSYSRSFAVIYLNTIAFGGVALIASYWSPNVDSMMTNFVNKRVDGIQRTTQNVQAVEESQGGVKTGSAENC
ncbi:siderophore iron transporter [Apiospora arundinis]|uniref:Siderophore iron transporter n=1 Tax=Apiospora arundinis TaxID=335852 RepID=A0ABR2IUV0_9PEZI